MPFKRTEVWEHAKVACSGIHSTLRTAVALRLMRLKQVMCCQLAWPSTAYALGKKNGLDSWWKSISKRIHRRWQPAGGQAPRGILIH
jgi:hypothetical protein